jgi:hypothetical protein
VPLMNKLAHCASIAQQACEECTRSDSTGARVSVPLIVNLDVGADVSRPVNSGVMLLT